MAATPGRIADLPSVPTVKAFAALQLIGAGGLVIVVATAALCKRIKRWPTWYSFCISWIISSLSYSLLTIAGQQFDELPDRTLCLVQAAGIYAAPPLTTCTTLSFIVHILLRLRFAKSDSIEDSDGLVIAVLIFAPYTVWIVILVGFLLFTIHNFGTLAVATTGTYCNSNDPMWAQMGFTTVIIVSAGIVLIQAYLGAFIYQNSELGLDNSNLFTTAMRALVFGSIGILTTIVAVVYATRPVREVTFDILLSVFPVLALLTFGTQPDLLDTWAFWRRRPSYTPLTGGIH